jgi:tRNA 2-selenouridine synthase
LQLQLRKKTTASKGFEVKFVAVAIKKITLPEFVDLAGKHPVIDVRSPGEYNHAHIPGAYSLPLFSDEERKIVGTAYKQESREKAIKLGLDFFGKKMVGMVEEVEKLISGLKPGPGSGKTVLIHCWRGGMRSAGVAWLLDLYGFKVYTLAGGYKAFRNWVLEQFQKEYNIYIIGGYTGSAKTYVLKELQKQREAVVDLEGIASHKGSAFGNIGLPAQPSQEMFENLLAAQLSTVNCQPSTALWMEDESQRIGSVNIPTALFQHMRTRPVFFLDIPFEERLDHLVQEYGKLDKEKMVNAIMRIQKRLGGLETKNAINFLIEGNVKESFSILLKYYDKWYGKSLQSRQNWEQLVSNIPAHCDAPANAKKLQQLLINQSENING